MSRNNTGNKKMSPNELIVGFIFAMIANILSMLVWSLSTGDISIDPKSDNIFYSIILNWPNNVVAVNLTVTAITVLFFTAISIINRKDKLLSITFAIWCLAWVVQFWGVLLAVRNNLSFVFLEGLCTLLILAGALYIRGRLFSFSALFLIFPIIAAILSWNPETYVWPLILVQFGVYLFFSITLYNQYRNEYAIAAYFIFLSYSLYASIQFLFPFMQFIDQIIKSHSCTVDNCAVNVASEQLVKSIYIFGYTMGIVAKSGGFLGFLMMTLKIRNDN